ncbi:unnamed protein product [Camellia sinensis]
MIFPEGGGREAHRQEEIKQYYKYFLWSLVFTIPVFLTSTVFIDFKVGVIYPCSVHYWPFYTGSYKALGHGSANTDVLIALGTNAAYFYSVYSVLRAATSPNFKATDFFETSAMFISKILLG